MGHKRKLVCKKAKIAKRINVVFTGIDWILFLGFSILAAHFMIGVLDHYQAKTTSFTKSLEPITSLPTIVMCIETGARIYDFEKLVKLSYIAEGSKVVKIDNVKENEIYDLKGANEIMQVIQVEEKCIMLSSNLTSHYQPGERIIRLKYGKNVKSIHFYFTSKENSVGYFFGQWWNGQVLDIVVQGGRRAKVSLQTSEHRYLNFSNQCSYTSHVDKWASSNTIRKEDFSNCPKECSPIKEFSHILPMCGWKEKDNKARGCAANVMIQSFKNFTKVAGYKRPCQVKEYHGYKTYDKENRDDNSLTELLYTFAPPMMSTVQEEYLIFDVTGMVGSVGGTLGMCIGFSFSGVTTNILDFIKARILNYF